MGMQNLYFPGKPVVWGAGAQAGEGVSEGMSPGHLCPWGLGIQVLWSRDCSGG